MTSDRPQQGFSLIELLIVVAIALIIGGFAVPSFLQSMRNFRISGDARSINGELLTAKMRAAARFTRTRVRFERVSRQFRSQWWDRTLNGGAGGWADEAVGAPQQLSRQVFYGPGDVTMNPAGDAIGFASACLDDDGVTVIPSTACVVFNSRGIPIDSTGSPVASNQIWINDTNQVHGVTVSITGLTQVWRTESADTSGSYWVRH
jgi:prepilin-type N-terminal cleavage/methylation domain-containing protein